MSLKNELFQTLEMLNQRLAELAGAIAELPPDYPPAGTEAASISLQLAANRAELDARLVEITAAIATAPAGAPVGAQYVTLATGSGLVNARVLTAGGDIDVSDGGASGPVYVSAGAQLARRNTENTFTAAQAVRVTDTATAAATTVATVERDSGSGAPAAGYGAGLSWLLRSSITPARQAAVDSVHWNVSTDAVRASERRFSLLTAGALYEALRITPNGMTLWNRQSSINGNNYGLVFSDVNPDGRIMLQHSGGGGFIIFYRGNAVEINSANLRGFTRLTECFIGSSLNNGTSDTYIRSIATGTGAGQAIQFRSTLVGGTAANAPRAEWFVPRFSILDNDGTMPEQFRVEKTAVATETPLLLLHNGTLKRVEVGDTDSGGTGYRQLRIAN